MFQMGGGAVGDATPTFVECPSDLPDFRRNFELIIGILTKNFVIVEITDIFVGNLISSVGFLL